MGNPRSQRKGRRLNVSNPLLCKEWDYKLNNGLTPDQFKEFSGEGVWWKCPASKDHIFYARISDRVRGHRCPCCPEKNNGKIEKVVQSNCLATTHPKLARQWHPIRNRTLTPYHVTRGTTETVWWQCEFVKDHVWFASVNARTNGRGDSASCVFCRHQNDKHGKHFGLRGARIPRSISLAKLRPDLAKQWHKEFNWPMTPDHFTINSHQRVWWKCEKKEKHFWIQNINNRNANNSGCPICAGQIVDLESSLATRFPDIAKQLHPVLNGNLTADCLSPGSSKFVWWQCQNNRSHFWRASPQTRTTMTPQNGCRECSYSQSKEELRIIAELKTIFPKLSIAGAKIITTDGRFGVDIYIPELKTIIEYDGYYHHRAKSRQERDWKKSMALRLGGYRLIRIREKPLLKIHEHDISVGRKFKLWSVMKALLRKLNTVAKPSSRIRIDFQRYLEKGKPKALNVSDHLIGRRHVFNRD